MAIPAVYRDERRKVCPVPTERQSVEANRLTRLLELRENANQCPPVLSESEPGKRLKVPLFKKKAILSIFASVSSVRIFHSNPSTPVNRHAIQKSKTHCSLSGVSSTEPEHARQFMTLTDWTWQPPSCLSQCVSKIRPRHW